MTLLELVQKILSAIDSNNVSSVNDSVESEQVGLIIQRVYDDIMTRKDWDFLREEGTLTPVVGSPTKMRLPDNTLTVERIKYNKKEVSYIEPDEMRDLLDNRSGAEFNSEGFKTTSDPIYWTSFDDEIILFDGYDSASEANLLESKSYIKFLGYKDELRDDSDVVDMPIRFNHALLQGCLALAFDELKGDSTAAASYRAEYKRALSRLQRWGRQIDAKKPDYRNGVDYGKK